MKKNGSQMKPTLFISSMELNVSNQQTYRISQATKFIKEQQEINKQITASLTDVHQSMKASKLEQKQYYQDMLGQIQKQEHAHSLFGMKMEQQEQSHKELIERIQLLEAVNHELKKKLERDEFVQQAILDGLTAQDAVGQRVTQKIIENEVMLETINEQLTKQEELYHHLTENLEIQDAFHQTIMEKIEHQEALTQKLSRQMDHLKSVIFERFSFLSEKIESSWKFTSHYLFGFLSKSEQKILDNEDIEKIEEVTKQ